MTHLVSERLTQAPWVKTSIFLAPIVLLGGPLILKIASTRYYWRLVREDGPIEYLTSLIYLVAFLIALSVGRRFYQQGWKRSGVLYSLLSLGFLFICLEEISWGQRIFGVQSPEFFEQYNVQGEINVHNFAQRYLLHAAYLLVSAYGAFTAWLLPRRVVCRYATLVKLFVPGRTLFLYFFPCFLLYAYYDYLSPVLVSFFGPQFGWESGRGENRFMIARDQEVVEFVLSMGFLMFVAINKWRQNSGQFSSLTSDRR